MSTERTTLLDQLNLPEDLKNLSLSELETLAKEIRQRLIEIGNNCGGHLASNLGIVELTLALHSVFDSPTDKFIFDTSHQCYVHKMLTGRLDQMMTIRQEGGLSGFAKISESDHDTFGAGHASTALSAGLGVAHARNIKKEDYHVVSIIGDASLSGGMAFEALNNTEKLKGNFICILNDNDMSISHPVGNMSNYINTLRTSTPYNAAKERFEKIIESIPAIGVPLKHRIEKAVDRFRDLVMDVKVGVLFEEFGFRYIGPIDGHNIAHVMAALRYARSYDGPIMLHMITQKGKGHSPAEEDPVKYHGVSPKKKESPKIEVAANEIPAPPLKSFTQIFGEECMKIAKKRDDVVVITPAMTGGSGLTEYAAQFPDQFFDVGIAEEHAVTFAAGLARAGVKPILSIYSTFLQRGYDQVVHDVCLQKLPVVFALDRAGVVGQDGPTHHGVFDYSFLLSIPNIEILAPKDGEELKAMMNYAIEQDIAVSIRYPKGSVPEQNGRISQSIDTRAAEVMLTQTQSDRNDILIVGVGSMGWPGYEAARILQEKGVNACAVNLRFIKPLDTDTLQPLIDQSNHVVVVEEGSRIGGVSAYMQQQLQFNLPSSHWHSIAFDDQFIDHGSVQSLRDQQDLSINGIVRNCEKWVSDFRSEKKSSTPEKNFKAS